MNLISTAARRFTVRRRRFVLLIAALAPGLAQADAVIDWNTTAWQTATAGGGPPIQTRINTITHLAIHDALNSIELRYEPYAGTHPAARGASPDAAVATAAYMTLSITVPSQAAALETTYDTYLAGLTCPAAYPSCVSDGIAVGAAAAEPTAMPSLTQSGNADGHVSPAR